MITISVDTGASSQYSANSTKFNFTRDNLPIFWHSFQWITGTDPAFS